MIGRRLKVARTSAGLSLRDLAARMDGLVTAQAIGKYERNESMPGSRVLMALATALAVSEDYLLSAEDLVLEGVDFRKKTSAREEATVEARTLQLLERYLAVEDMLGLRSVDWEQPRGAPYPVADLRDAEDAARSVRQEWGLGHDPIPKLAELLEERGIKVLSLDLEDIDGMAARVRRHGREAARVVVVRKNIWAERKRFTLAHELGHMCIALTGDVDEERQVGEQSRCVGGCSTHCDQMGPNGSNKGEETKRLKYKGYNQRKKDPTLEEIAERAALIRQARVLREYQDKPISNPYEMETA